jgi:hypothetical protein
VTSTQTESEIQAGLEEKEFVPWVGVELTLRGEWVDRFGPGMLSNPAHFPARHVLPPIREAAEQVLSVQASRDAWVSDCDARPAGLDRLLAESSQQDVAAVGKKVAEFEATTKAMKYRIAALDQAVRDAWEVLAGTLHNHGAEWNEYLYAALAAHLETPVGPIWNLPNWLSEPVLIEDLLWRESILVRGNLEGAEWHRNNARMERKHSAHTILYGGSSAGETPQGVMDLVMQWRALGQPEPVVEPEPEPEPLAVRLQRERSIPSGIHREPF